MKDHLFNALYCLGIAGIFIALVTIVTFFYAFLKIFYSKIVGQNCKHTFKVMTDKVGSPVICQDCGKTVR